MNNVNRSNKKPDLSALVKASKDTADYDKVTWVNLFPEPYRTKLNNIKSWWDNGSRNYCTAMDFLEGSFPWDESPDGRDPWEVLCEEIRDAVSAAKDADVVEEVLAPVKAVPPSPSPFAVVSPESRSVFNEELTAFSNLPQSAKDILNAHRRDSEHYDFGGGGWAVRADDYKGTRYFDDGVYRYIAEGAVAPLPTPKAKADPIPVPKQPEIEYVFWKQGDPLPETMPEGVEWNSQRFGWTKSSCPMDKWTADRRWPKQPTTTEVKKAEAPAPKQEVTEDFSALIKASINSKSLPRIEWIELFPEPYKSQLKVIDYRFWWDSDSTTYTDVSEFLHRSFSWGRMEQGAPYWADLQEKLDSLIEEAKAMPAPEQEEAVPAPEKEQKVKAEEEEVADEDKTAQYWIAQFPEPYKSELQHLLDSDELLDPVFTYYNSAAEFINEAVSWDVNSAVNWYNVWDILDDMDSADETDISILSIRLAPEAGIWNLDKLVSHKAVAASVAAIAVVPEVQKVTPVKSPALITEADIGFYEIPLEVNDEGFICGRLPGKSFRFRLTELMSHEKFMGIVYQHGDNLWMFTYIPMNPQAKAVCVRMRK